MSCAGGLAGNFAAVSDPYASFLIEEAAPRYRQTAAALRAHHEAEIKPWWRLIKAAGIKIE